MSNPAFIPYGSNQQPADHHGSFMVKPYSPAELCQVYGVSLKTWRKWMEPFNHLVGKRCGRYYTVQQVKTIIRHLGFPHWLE